MQGPGPPGGGGTRLSKAVGPGAVRRGQGVRELGAACGRDPRNSDSMRARRQRCAGRPQSDERRTPSDGENPPAGACGVLMGYAYAGRPARPVRQKVAHKVERPRLKDG